MRELTFFCLLLLGAGSLTGAGLTFVVLLDELHTPLGGDRWLVSAFAFGLIGLAAWSFTFAFNL